MKAIARLLWIAAAVIASAALIAVLIWERRPADARRALDVVGVPERGATLFYGQKQCSVCHSINGSGGRIAPDLSARVPARRPWAGWQPFFGTTLRECSGRYAAASLTRS